MTRARRFVTVVRMRRPVVTLAVLLLVLTGCTPRDEVVVPDPEPTVEPMFASDEEALAAAEEAYGAYLAASDASLAGGGVERGELYKLVTERMREEIDEDFDSIGENGWIVQGNTSFDSAVLQSLVQEPDYSDVTIYLCADVSNNRVIDALGADVTPADRADRVPLEVQLVSESGSGLKLERSDYWPDQSICL